MTSPTPAPPPLAAAADLTRFGYTLPADRADGLLARASARIRRAAGQSITPSQVVWEAVPEHGRVVLPAPPVLGIVTVEALADGAPTAPVTDWQWDGDRLTVPWTVGRVRVTYRRGYDPVPDGIVELACEVAARLAHVPEEGEGMVRQRSIDDYSVTYATEQIVAGGDLMPGELSALAQALGVPEAFMVRSR
ncbi:hypothetical protein AB0A77_28320 [Streptomyces varsoviensis]|uniref:hypothetical protein n=1 Tax=Streptomyces varsoviensis TaxID=67373 RepID=UPI003404B8A4